MVDSGSIDLKLGALDTPVVADLPSSSSSSADVSFVPPQPASLLSNGGGEREHKNEPVVPAVPDHSQSQPVRDEVTNTNSDPQTDPGGATASRKRGRARKGKPAPAAPRARPKRVARSKATQDNPEQQTVTTRRSHHKKIAVEAPAPQPTARPPDPPVASCQCRMAALNFAIATLNSIGAQVHAAVAQLTAPPPPPPPPAVSDVFQPLIQQLVSSSGRSSHRSDRSPSASSSSRSRSPHSSSHHHSTSSSSSSHHHNHHHRSAHRADRSP